MFVFDGPGRPWKHGSCAGKIDYNRTRLLRKLLTNLKIRYHEAPGEAEAECARFQEQGIVDAVWSDDGDTLMFGATVLIRSYKDENSAAAKSKTHVRVYRADKIKRKFGLDRPSLVLFSLLAGGDYNEKGLEGCGATTAFAAVKWQDGRLGKMLATADLKNLGPFTAQLAEYFQRHSRSRVHVPPDFPRALHVGHYRDPKVTEGFDKMQDQAEKLARLWDAEIDEDRLRAFLRESFDIQTKDYIKHIVPVLLVNRVIKTSTLDAEARRYLDIKLVHKRGKTADDYNLERLMTCNPLACSKLDLKTRPQDLEDWTRYTNKKTGEKWDPGEHVEIEMLDIFLERGLGPVEMVRLKEEASKPKIRKRKNAAGGDDEEATNGDGNAEHVAEVSAPATKRRKSNNAAPTDVVTNTQPEAGPANTKRKRQSQKDTVQARQGRSPELGESPSKLHNPPAKTNSAKPSTKKRKSNEPSDREPEKERETTKAQRAVFRLPTAIQNLTAEQRRVLHQEGVQVWHLDNVGEGSSASLVNLPSAASKPRHAPPPAGFDRVIRTEPVPFNGSNPLADLTAARSNVAVIASSPPLPSSSTARLRSTVSVPKPAPATRVDSGTEMVDLCEDEQDGIQSGTIGPNLSSQEHKDRRFAEDEAKLRKRIAEHEIVYRMREWDETVRTTVRQKLDQCRASLLQLLSDEAANTIDKLKNMFPPGGGLSTPVQEQRFVYDQVIQFRAALECRLDAMRGPFSEACALENVFHGDVGNALAPSLTGPTEKNDLAVMKFAVGVDIGLEFRISRLSCYIKGPKSGPDTPRSDLPQPGANDVDTISMTDETPSRSSRTLSVHSTSRSADVGQRRTLASTSRGDVLTQDNQHGTPKDNTSVGYEVTTEITQRSTRSNGSAGLVKPNNWARVVERAIPLQVSADPAATASMSTQDGLDSNTTISNDVHGVTVSHDKHNQGSIVAPTSPPSQSAIYDIDDDDTDEDGENERIYDDEIQEALRRSKQDQFSTAYSSTFASSSRAAYPTLSITSKAQRTDFSESPHPASGAYHDTVYADVEAEQPISYAGKGKAPMYPSLHTMEASSNDLSGAYIQHQERQSSPAFAVVPDFAPISAPTLPTALTRSPTLPPAPTWACINKPHNPPQAPSANSLPSSSTTLEDAGAASSAPVPTPAKALGPKPTTIAKQTSFSSSSPATANSGNAIGGKSREDLAAARVAHFKDVIKNVLPSSPAASTLPNTTARRVAVRSREVIDLCEETTEEEAAAARLRNREKERRRMENRASLGNVMGKGKGVCIDLTLD